MWVAIAQTGPVADDDLHEPLHNAERLARAASAKGAALIVFCELFATPFFPKALDDGAFTRYFTAWAHADIQRFYELARELRIGIVLPFAEKADDGYYNSAALIDADGTHAGIYRKTHIPAYFPTARAGGTGSYEKLYFRPGSELPVFDLCGIRIGVQICNDRLYPEASRVLAIRGANIIVAPISYATYGEDAQREQMWPIALQARAFENGVYVLAVNKAGWEDGRRHIGRSLVVRPDGSIQREAGSEGNELLIEAIDLQAITKARQRFAWWRDRRVELYYPVIQ